MNFCNKINNVMILSISNRSLSFRDETEKYLVRHSAGLDTVDSPLIWWTVSGWVIV